MIYVTTILSVIDIAMSVLALIGVSTIRRNIKDKPGLTIDYDGADRAGLTDNDDEEEQ